MCWNNTMENTALNWLPTITEAFFPLQDFCSMMQFWKMEGMWTQGCHGLKPTAWPPQEPAGYLERLNTTALFPR